MKSAEVAKLLNLGYEEFTQIEESIAMVFQLKKDEQDEFVYTEDHIKALKDVFDNSDMDFDFLKSASMPSEPKQAQAAIPKKIAINRKKATPAMASMDGLSDSNLQAAFPSDKAVRLPAFRHVTKEGVDKDPNSHGEGVDESVSMLWDKLEEQKSYFNSKFDDFKGQELSLIRSENYTLKKQNLQMQKELETLQNIIKSQNDDKQYLIDKLDEKYSIKGLFNWKKDPYLSA
ncbi:hypothetical protein MJH12_15555 [bacterium]|nr:hypothetical protein [bacterium]